MSPFSALVTRIGDDKKSHMSLENVELGQPDKNKVLVRIHAVAQNPTDSIRSDS